MEIRDGVTAMDQAVRGLDNRFQEIDSNIVELKGFISERINDALASKNRMFQMLKDVVSGKVLSSFHRKWRSFQTVFSMRRTRSRADYESHTDCHSLIS